MTLKPWSPKLLTLSLGFLICKVRRIIALLNSNENKWEHSEVWKSVQWCCITISASTQLSLGPLLYHHRGGPSTSIHFPDPKDRVQFCLLFTPGPAILRRRREEELEKPWNQSGNKSQHVIVCFVILIQWPHTRKGGSRRSCSLSDT